MELNRKILIVDDSELWIFSLREKLKGYGFVTAVKSLKEGLEILETQKFDIAFFDLDLEERWGGLKLVSKAKDLGLYNVILSSNDDVDIVKKGYTLGCMDYLVKPISTNAIELVFKKLDLLKNERNVEELLNKNFITYDPQTRDSLEIIKRINLSEKSILLSGESGTGKTCLAKIIHDISKGSDAEFVSLNCSQFSDSMIDSELFGHVKGSFTGATRDKKGLIEKARGGTLFLDEVHSLTPRAQQKLLKALDEGIIYPVGSERPVEVKFRVICATCELLDELVFEKKFRRDLYYRIKTFEINLKPLRERKLDILPLIQFFLNKKERKIVLDEEVEEILKSYQWPANSREISDLVENWHVNSLGYIKVSDLPKKFFEQVNSINSENFFTEEQIKLLSRVGLKDFSEIVREKAIFFAMDEKNGKQIEAAKKLMISKSTISKALEKIKGGTNEYRIH